MSKKYIAILLAMIGTSLYAEATGIDVYQVATFSTPNHVYEKDGQWDVVYNSANTIYNAQSGHYVTKSCHTAPYAIMDVVVWGTGINKTPRTGAGGDMTPNSTYTASSYKIFRFIKDDPNGADTSGEATAFYSEGYDVLSSMDKFLRYP